MRRLAPFQLLVEVTSKTGAEGEEELRRAEGGRQSGGDAEGALESGGSSGGVVASKDSRGGRYAGESRPITKPETRNS